MPSLNLILLQETSGTAPVKKVRRGSFQLKTKTPQSKLLKVKSDGDDWSVDSRSHEEEEAYDSLAPLPVIPRLRRNSSYPLVPSAPEQRVLQQELSQLR